MIYSINDITYNNHILEKVRNLLGENTVPLHEYYERVDTPKDAHVLKGLRIDIYKLDRTEMTPHVHIKDTDGTEIEVSLIDWKIVNVKHPNDKSNDWSNFTDIRDRFFKWVKENYRNLFNLWNQNNSDNQVDNSYINDDISPELRNYLETTEDPISLEGFRKAIYGTLSPLFSNKEDKSKLKDLDTITLLKTVGLFDEFRLSENSSEALKVAEDAIRDVKIWFSYV